MKRFYLFTVLVLSLFTNCFSQDPKTAPQITPPSPNAAALQKYGNIPVSPYTGVADVSVPLYEIKIRDISVPISISYHGSGIKVGEEASRVGLGWSLNAGGVISRNIMNRDDLQEVPDAYASSNSIVPQMPIESTMRPIDAVIGGTKFLYYTGDSQTAETIDYTQFLYWGGIDPLRKEIDLEPDQFYYNFSGHSGKFVLDKFKNVYTEKWEPIKFQYSTSDETWDVTTPDGYIYKFKVWESFVDYNTTPGYDQKSAWYLTEIVSPTNEKVQFFYTVLSDRYIKPTGVFYERRVGGTTSLCSFECQNKSGDTYRAPLVGKNYTNVILDSIAWNQGWLKFNVAWDRKDLPTDVRIASIEVHEKGSSEPFKVITFKQDYFETSKQVNGSVNEFPTDDPAAAAKRLRLKSVSKAPVQLLSDQQPEVHLFDYYDGGTYESLPPKTSFARDHWGYYNGRRSNSSLLPSYKPYTQINLRTDMLGIMGIERDADERYTAAGSLKSITYPTKGVTTFTYESNDYEVGTYIDPAANPGTPPDTYPGSANLSYDMTERGSITSKTLDLHGLVIGNIGNTGTVTVKGHFRFTKNIDEIYEASLEAYFQLVSVGKVDIKLPRCTGAPGNNYPCLVLDGDGKGLSYTNTYTLPRGVYQWLAYTNDPDVADINATYEWTIDAHVQPREGQTNEKNDRLMYRVGGGIRIKSIVDYAPESQVPTRTFYDYHYKDWIPTEGVYEIHSYGKRMVIPSYAFFEGSFQQGQSEYCLSCLQVVYDSGHPYANYDGFAIGYDRVYEDKDQLGTTSYEFENNSNVERNNGYRYPYFPKESIPIEPPQYGAVPNPGNGNIRRKIDYSTAGGYKKRVRMVINDWAIVPGSVLYGIKVVELPNDFRSDAPTPRLLVSYPALIQNFQFLQGARETIYMDNGDSVVRNTTYRYDNLLHRQLTSTKTTRSDGRTNTTSYKYLLDYPTTERNAVLNLMETKFMHAMPLEVSVTEDQSSTTGKLVQRDFNIYGIFNIDGGQAALLRHRYELQTKDSLPVNTIYRYVPNLPPDSSIFKKSMTFGYDERGNMNLVQKANDMPVTYLWGYDKNLPVAEIKNARSASVYYNSFESNEGSLLANAKTGYKVKSGSTFQFTGFSPPDPTKIVMSYWYLVGTEWKYSGVVPYTTNISIPAASAIDEVRAYPKNALMSTFSYRPLVGVQSQTDEKGATTYYEYDYLGRLKLVRDQFGSIVKTYGYRFRK